MPTFIYSPGIRIYIETERKGTLDVSEDVTGGSLVRRQDGVSTFDFGLMNTRRKYDGVFTPNDRIVVMMKRLTWLRVFSGYLNTVPLKTIWPREVPLSATCSLKRLQYWFWDPTTSMTQNLIRDALSVGVAGSDEGTGGVMNVLLTVLDKVTGWPASKVHIGKIPENWFDIALDIAKDVEGWTATDQQAAWDFLEELSPGALFGGIEATSAGVGGSEAGASGATLGAGAFGGTLKSTAFAGIGTDAQQRNNAEIIMGTGWDILAVNSEAKGHEAHALATALDVAMVESTLRNLASQANPESLEVPHETYPGGAIPEGDGSSVGLFQQIDAWGTVADRMDPVKSSTKFFNALLDTNGWQDTAIATLAQEIQRSGFPARYAKYDRMGSAMVTEMIRNKRASGTATTTGTTGSASQPAVITGQYLAQNSVDLVQTYSRIRYVYGADLGTKVDPPAALDCSSCQQWFYLMAAGGLGGFYGARTSAQQAGWCDQITTQEALDTPGALLFVSSNGAASGVHHVEMSLGDGQKTVGAHHTGTNASVADASNNSWSFGGLIPNVTYDTNANPATSGQTGPVLAGGTGHYPLTTTHRVTTAYHKAGTTWDCGYHTGVDFGDAETGDAITSICPGTVVAQSYAASSYGNYATVQSGDFQVIYGHMSVVDPGCKVGAKLDTGSPIGEVGDSGKAYGAHLHLEVRKAPYQYGEDDIDPINFIENGATSTTPIGGGGAAGAVLDFFGIDAFEWPLIKDQPDFDPTDPIDELFGDYIWYPLAAESDLTTRADSLVGAHALQNDQTLLPFIKNLFASTLRSFCSAPNGDLIGWFPDYYGLWGTAGKLRLEPIEILDFNVFWSDDNFVTHQFAKSGWVNHLDLSTGTAETEFYREAFADTITYGVANIDSPAVLSSLLGIEPKDGPGFARWVYDKFGARPDMYYADGLIGFKAELFAAIHMFMIQWAYQYRAEIPLTFMPEAWPGMLVQSKEFDFQAYITTVTHSFQFGDGGKFETTLNIAAPAYMPRGKADKSHALFGLPLAGGYSGDDAVPDSADAYGNPDVPDYNEPDVPKQEVSDPV